MKNVKMILKNKQNLIDILILILIVLYLLSYFKPSLILSNTTLTGGDTGSHVFVADYMKNHLFNEGSFFKAATGWTHEQYAGMPLVFYYFPLAYIITSLLSYFFLFNVAFKLTTILGIFLLPLMVYFSMKLMKFKFPVPIFGAISSLLFLFLEGFPRWGGGILSVLTGQFSYSISLALSILFIGLLYRGITLKKYSLLNAFLVALIAFSHIYTTICLVIASCFFVLFPAEAKRRENFLYLAKVWILGFCLIGFWTVPYLFKLDFTSPLGWIANRSVEFLAPPLILPFLVLAVIACIFSLKKRYNIQWLAFLGLVSVLLFALAPTGYLWNLRFLPLFYVFALMLGSYGLYLITRKLELRWMLPILLILVVIIALQLSVNTAPSWIEWNYEGYENKPSWPQFESIQNYLGELPYGRVLHEHSVKFERFGSERVFEATPYFSGQPAVIGLHFDAAPSTYFLFYLWSEISEEPGCPLARAGCSEFNLEKATQHADMYNIRYFLAVSPTLKEALNKSEDYIFLERFRDIEIYERVGEHNFVVVSDFQPGILKTSDWKGSSLTWFENGSSAYVPVVLSEEITERDKERFFVVQSEANLTDLPQIAMDKNCTISEELYPDRILINTTCLNKPLIIKISYFPNWKVKGADKVYLVTPSLMLIYPEQEAVEVYYGLTLSDYAGRSISVITVFFFVFSLIRFTFRNLKKSGKTIKQGKK